MRRLVGATTVLAGLALLFSAAAFPAYADPGGDPNANANANARRPVANGGGAGNGGGGASQTGDPNGANGTVKIHNWPDHKNGSEMANDPKVCRFEIHGFKFDAAQSGSWWIQAHKWGSGDRSKAVLSGSYGPADGDGDWTSGPHSLADGHYKLYVELTHRAGNSGNTVTTYKMKVFKVDCAAVAGTTPAPTPTPTPTGNLGGDTTPTPTPTPSPQTVVGGSESAPGSSTTTAVIGGVTVRTQTTIVTEGGQQVRIVRVFNDDVLLSETRSAVLGAQNAADAALAALGSLPATSTGGGALGALGLAITGLGLAMLRGRRNS